MVSGQGLCTQGSEKFSELVCRLWSDGEKICMPVQETFIFQASIDSWELMKVSEPVRMGSDSFFLVWCNCVLKADYSDGILEGAQEWEQNGSRDGSYERVATV